eukprot:379542-Prymnesium_polylepis.1
MAALICFCALSVPLEIAFEQSLRDEMGPGGWRAWENFTLVGDIAFIVDIVLSFRTGYLDENNQLVANGRLIARNYMRGSFFIDLIGSFPLNFILDLTSSDDDGGSAAARLNRQLRLLR